MIFKKKFFLLLLLALFSSAANAQIFTEVSAEWLKKPDGSELLVNGTNLSLIDYNGDNYPDLLVSGSRGPKLFKNREGLEFVAINSQDKKDTVAGLFADCDADGDLDLFLTGGYSEESRLLLNYDGRGDFRQSSALPPLGPVVSAAWVDYNRDGLVDLAIGGWGSFEEVENGLCSKDRIFKNLGQCQFAEVALATGEEDKGCSNLISLLPNQEIIETAAILTSLTR